MGRIFPRATLTLSDGTPRSIDEISRSKFVLVGIGVDVQWLRTLMIHPLARQHRWREIAISLDGSEAGAKTEIEVARIVGEDVKRTLSDYQGKLLLARPDGYVALAGDHRSIAGDMDALWRSFG
ncbi:hypothetical protein [Bradyrhizobium sp. PRIMUS42]|uniref:hypothetical protein n=1 Tax=Bradyrhizobium sp. PRIMUS42 TaxID=2908926 RepID=UPI0034D98102